MATKKKLPQENVSPRKRMAMGKKPLKVKVKSPRQN